MSLVAHCDECGTIIDTEASFIGNKTGHHYKLEELRTNHSEEYKDLEKLTVAGHLCAGCLREVEWN